MGNSNTSNWKSPMDDDQDEKEVQEWLKWKGTPLAQSRNGRVRKMAPGMDVLAVQPVYLAHNQHYSKKKSALFSYSEHEKIKGLPLSRSSSFNEETDYNSKNTNTKLDDLDPQEGTQNNNSIGPNDLESHNLLAAENDNQSLSELHDLDEKQCKFPTGELNVSLSYDPTSDRMKVFVIKAKNLSCKPREEKHDKFGVSCSESYITVTLIARNRVQQTFSTALKKNGHVEILFYENFAFYLKKGTLKHAILEIKAMHRCKNILKSNHVVGRILIGGQSVSDVTETHQWYEAISNPRQVVTKWHTFWG